jgi:CDP-glucose 4,6-dehydratase
MTRIERTPSNPDRAFWKGRRVFVTGHTGFQGSWLVLWLSDLGADVVGFSLPADNPPNLFPHARNPPHVQSVWGDVRDPAAIAQALSAAAPSVVVHLAAQALLPRSYRDPVETFATNVLGTVHLLEAIRTTGTVQAAVLVTSDKCYRNPGTSEPFAEDAVLGGSDPYGSSKACAEIAIGAYRASFMGAREPSACRIASVRPGNVIGGGDWSENRLMPDLVRAAQDDLPVSIRNPDGVRPWQHVLEPLYGYLLLAERLCGPDGTGFAEAWNLGPADDDCRPVSFIVERFASAWGRAMSTGPARQGAMLEADALRIDSTKAIARLGWRPRLKLEAAIDWTAEWHRRYLNGEPPELIALDQIHRYLNRSPDERH